MTDIVKVLLWLWQLPQNIVAAIIVLIYGAKKVRSGFDNIDVFEVPASTSWMGVSLGNNIIYNQSYNSAPHLKTMILGHEYGHCKQSILFGPLYLIIIGIPSVLNVLYVLANPKKADTYYKRWPENLADKLGGIDRNKPIPIVKAEKKEAVKNSVNTTVKRGRKPKAK